MAKLFKNLILYLWILCLRKVRKTCNMKNTSVTFVEYLKVKWVLAQRDIFQIWKLNSWTTQRMLAWATLIIYYNWSPNFQLHRGQNYNQSIHTLGKEPCTSLEEKSLLIRKNEYNLIHRIARGSSSCWNCFIFKWN